MGWYSLRLSSSLDEGHRGKFPGFIVRLGNLWVEARCTVAWSIASRGCIGSEPSACLILAQFINGAASAVFWTPDSLLFAWMSTVVTCGLASSSGASSLWFECSWLAYLGMPNSSLECLGSEPYACCVCGSVLCLRCYCRIVDP